MFKDRLDAGRQLARRLAPYAALEPVVVGLPRGGVPVAAEVADRLGVPLDVVVVRKIGCPWRPELGIGVPPDVEHEAVILHRPISLAPPLRGPGGLQLGQNLRNGRVA